LNEKEAEASEKSFRSSSWNFSFYEPPPPPDTQKLSLNLFLVLILPQKCFSNLTQTATITAIEAIRLGRQSFSCCYKVLKQQFNDHIGAKMKTFLIN